MHCCQASGRHATYSPLFATIDPLQGGPVLFMLGALKAADQSDERSKESTE
jgi:hypothetical protein